MNYLKKYFLLIFCLFSLTAVGQDIDNGRIALYNFSGNANDVVNSVNGTVFGATLTNDRFGNFNSAYSFDGTNDYISIPSNSANNFAADEDFSISLWIYLPEFQKSIPGNEIIGKWNAVNNSGYPFAVRYFNENNPNGFEQTFVITRYDTEVCNHVPVTRSPCKLATELWYHIVYTKNGNVLSMYQNGILIDSIEDNTSLSCNTINDEPVYIGKRQANQRHFSGKVDDISFYNRAISNDEVHLLFTENNWSAPPSNDGTDILTFQFTEEVEPSKINLNTHAINVLVACDTDITNLKAVFSLSNGASAEVLNIPQTSGVNTNNFTNPVIYTVKSENECATQDWIITVNRETINSNEVNKLTSFSQFSFPQQNSPSIIDITNHSISVIVPCDTNMKNLVANYVVPNNSLVKIDDITQTSGSSINDFTNPVIYTVISENECATQDWIITVNRETLASNEVNELTSFSQFSFPQQNSPSIIDITNHSISVMVPCDTNMKNLVANYVVPNNSLVKIDNITQTSGSSINDFTNPVIYTVISENECATQDWIITVNRETLTSNEVNELTSFSQFSFPQQNSPSIIDITNHSISVIVPCDANMKNLVANYVVPSNSLVKIDDITQTSGSSINDFTNPVIYTVISENECATQDWIITVNRETLTSNEVNELTSFSQFSFPQQNSPSIIDITNHSISVIVPCDANMKNLVANYVVPNNSLVKIDDITQTSGSSINDFTNPVIYTVISENECATQDWVVTVELEKNIEIDSLISFYYFKLSDEKKQVSYDSSEINIEVECYADLSKLTAYFNVAENSHVFVNGVIQESGTSTNDFSDPIKYEIVSVNKCLKRTWLVSVSKSKDLKTLFIPNVITPNEDSKNDYWELPNENDNIHYNVQILNRWGRIILFDQDYRNNWNAPDLSSGIYYYNISINNCGSNYNGWLHVLK